MNTAALTEFLRKHRDNGVALRMIALYFMNKYPEDAALVASAVEVLEPSESEQEPQQEMVTVAIPDGGGKYGGWAGALYRLPLEHVRDWHRIATSLEPGAQHGIVAAIKQCRTNTGLGLKLAKDLVEYVATQRSW